MNKCSTTRTYYTYIIQLFPFFFKNSKKQIHSTLKYEYYDSGFRKKSKKPLIGFEPMTYALPWRYSTTELKGPFNYQNYLMSNYVEKLSPSSYIPILI